MSVCVRSWVKLMDLLPPWAREQQSERLHCMNSIWGYRNRSWLLLPVTCTLCGEVLLVMAGVLPKPVSARAPRAGSGGTLGLGAGLHPHRTAVPPVPEIPEFMQKIRRWELRTLLIWELNRSLKGCCCSCQYLYDREIGFFSSSFWFEIKYLKFLFVEGSVLRQ